MVRQAEVAIGDEALEALNRMAAELLQAASMTTLVEENRQLFAGHSEANTGGETPLTDSLCQHVVRRGSPVVFPDVAASPPEGFLRSRDLGVGAYAGVPIRIRNLVVGAFCAVDARPRAWSSRDVDILGDLATAASAVIDLRIANREATLRDELTGLMNHALFEEIAGRAIERGRPGKGSAAVIAIGLDGFKLINDAFGFAAGDAVLREVAQRLKKTFRTADVLCRLGGDEFVALCEEVGDEEEARQIGERALRDVTEAPILVDGRPQRIGASLGIATAAGAGIGAARDLVGGARAAMSEVKAGLTGGQLPAARKLTLRNDIAGAPQRGELRLVYQPIVDLATHRPVAVEALARWDHPELGPVPPNEFIPVAEATGAAVHLGEWVLEQACADLERFRRRAPDLRLHVNVAPIQLSSSALPDRVGTALHAHHLPPDALVLELTERTLLDDRPAHRTCVERLTADGIEIALDDFGVGYSALSYLTTFPIGSLKLDRSFVGAGETDARSRALMRGIVAMADAIEMDVVAEGIETPSQRELALDIGCGFAQGYHFGRPVSAGELLAGLA